MVLGDNCSESEWELTQPDVTGQQEQGLGIAQQRAIELLLLGYKDAEVAAIVGVTRQTVNKWRNHNKAFIAELNHRRRELWEAAEEKLRNLIDSAITVLEEDLQSEDRRLRLRAAVHVLKCVGLYGKSLEPPGIQRQSGAEAGTQDHYHYDYDPEDEEWDLSDFLFGESRKGGDDPQDEELPKSRS